MARSLIATVLTDRAEDLADPALQFAELVIRDKVLRYAVHEAVVVMLLSLGLMAVVAAVPALFTPDTGVLIACILVLGYFLHLMHGMWQSGVVLWPAVRLGLGPRRLVRAILFSIVLRQLRAMEAKIHDAIENAPFYYRWPVQRVANWQAEPIAPLAFRVSLAMEPRLWRHALRAVALTLAPLFLLVFAFRYTVTWGQLLPASARLSVLDTLIYPLAWLADLVLGTGWHQALRGS